MSFLDRLRAAARAARERVRRPSGLAIAALAVFALAFGLRLYWSLRVESPFDNLFSDMAGYINRALQAAYGGTNPLPVKGESHANDVRAIAAAAAGVDPWTIRCPLYPPGAHIVYAAEIKLAGWTHHAALLALNCVWGAVVAPCALLLSYRVVPRLSVATLAGVFMATWYPLLAFCGFFSSEQPYAGAIALSAWFLVRQVERGKSAVALGVASSVAYLVRPQIVVTLAALSLLGLYLLVRRPARAPRLRLWRLVLAGSILTATVGWGAVRYHGLSGRWGLISDNSTMTRLWADTNYGRVKGVWHTPDGHAMAFFFESPPKAELGHLRELDFDGYVGDPAQIEKARRNEVNYMTFGDRVERWGSNVLLLFARDTLWPDSIYQVHNWRGAWFAGCQVALLGVLCPLALVGIVSGLFRPTTVPVVSAAHVVTALVVAAFFYGEARYRVPYDLFLTLLALEGARRLVALVAAGVRRWRARRARRDVPPEGALTIASAR